MGEKAGKTGNIGKMMKVAAPLPCSPGGGGGVTKARVTRVSLAADDCCFDGHRRSARQTRLPHHFETWKPCLTSEQVRLTKLRIMASKTRVSSSLSHILPTYLSAFICG